MTAGLDSEMLRALVREALADLLPAQTGAAGTAPARRRQRVLRQRSRSQ